MAKVTYLGTMDHQHKSNPSGTNYFFHAGIPTDVSAEDAIFYAEESKKEGPWHVDLGIVEKAAEIVKEVVQPKSKYKYGHGGKK